MTTLPGRGYTFLMPSGPGEDQKHLYILLTDKCPNNLHLAVSIQSVYPGEYYDPACVFAGGEHPFVTHLSWVAYHRAALLSHSKIAAMVENFEYRLKSPASEQMLRRIEAGLFVSKRASKKIRLYYQENKAAPDSADDPPDTA